tara:strand:- start:50 stop:325 length:276 start_codon:yes stop_codon:yes gene_type:complete
MIQKLEILDEKLDKLDEIDNSSFLFENFKEINFQIESVLFDLKSNEFSSDHKNLSENDVIIFNNILKKIERLESKILPKANLLESFSKFNT